MKRILLSVLGAVVAFTSCQKDGVQSGGDGREVTVAVTASLPETEATRAGGTSKSGMENVDWTNVSLRYTLEVYDGETLIPVQTNGATQRILYKTTKEDTQNVIFENVRLLSGRNYQFVIWADFVNKDNAELHYTTKNGLKNITEISSRAGSDDSRDAYFASENINVTAPTSKAITLKRPFGKLRVITTDIKHIHDFKDDVTTTVTYKTAVPTGFNAFDGTVSATKAVPAVYTASVSDVTEATATLAFDYIFAEATTAEQPVQTPVDFEVKCLGATCDFASSSVKIERNKLTTVKGNLLTKGVTVSVTVEDSFENEINNDIADVVPTVTAAQTKLEQAASEIGQPVVLKVTQPVTEEQTLIIPVEVKVENTPKIDLDFSAGISQDKILTITEEKPEDTSSHFAGEVYISVPQSDAAGLVVNMPSSTVYINGKLNALTATVSPNTLVIAKDAEIGTLMIHAGNVEILGKVKTLTKAEHYDGKIFWGAGTMTELQERIAKNEDNAGIILTADIDCGTTDGQNLVTIDRVGYQLDGRGYTLSGSAKQNLVVVVADAVMICNVKITNTQKAGMTVYCAKNVLLDGVIFEENKGSGLVVNGSTVTANNIKAVGTKGVGAINISQGKGVEAFPALTLTGINDIRKGSSYQIYADFASGTDKSQCLVADDWTLKGDPTSLYVSWTDEFVSPSLSSKWITDRTEPKEFKVSSGKITMTTLVTPTEGFYSWCGKTATVFNAPNNDWSIEMTYTKAGSNDVNKEVGLWGVVRPDNDSNLNYPIIAYYNENGVEGWKYFKAFGNSNEWVKIHGATVLDGANKMRISYEGGSMKYYVNDVHVATDETYSAKTGTVTAVIVNQKNTDTEYTSVVSVPIVKLNR